MNNEQFEQLLGTLCRQLTEECQSGTAFSKSAALENRAREMLQSRLQGTELSVDFSPHPYVFPDIVLGEWGIEVKFTCNDTWRSVANRVFESFRSEAVKHIYILFGKMGGVPEARWGKYEDCVIHARTSRVPRFEIELPIAEAPQRESLFQKFGLTYSEFCQLSLHERMQHIRGYARGRLKKGEKLWWLEDRPDQEHTLPIQARWYTSLSTEEKRKLRAEAALLCPQVVKSSRAKGKYDDATLYLLTYHGVLCNQARDLFSAGSVAGPQRGGIYILRALQDIQTEMRTAAATLDDALFFEYWGESVEPSQRIPEWLKRADQLAQGWIPSQKLFLEAH